MSSEPETASQAVDNGRPDVARSAPASEPGQELRGCDILVQCLVREGVDLVFGYPGGASMEIHQALTRSDIRCVLCRHGRRNRPKIADCIVEFGVFAAQVIKKANDFAAHLGLAFLQQIAAIENQPAAVSDQRCREPLLIRALEQPAMQRVEV